MGKTVVEIARGEIEKSRGYDYIVINDDLESAADEVLDIIEKIDK